MSEVEVRPDVDLNELYDQDVPCLNCGKAAKLRSFGHGCSSRHGPPPFFKCIGCWKKWVSEVVDWMSGHGGLIHCQRCNQHFATVASFSYYREF